MSGTPDRNRTYAMMIKPVGSRCNLRCAYCYYLGRGAAAEAPVMSKEVLESTVRGIITMHGADAVIEFAWHGGEPTLAGIDFFIRAIELERKYGRGRKIRNTLQTNATLIDDKWARFFKANGFMLGVSLDGPQVYHDKYRAGSFAKTMAGVEALKRAGVEFNILATINSFNACAPLEVYRFLREYSDYIQFLPVVEREGEAGRLAEPCGIYNLRRSGSRAEFSVRAHAFGEFMVAVFNEWWANDRGHIHVNLIDAALENRVGVPCHLCTHVPICGHSGSIDMNGDVYACDRFAYGDYKLGNLLSTPLGDLMEKNQRFGYAKTLALPHVCLECPVVRMCFGGCPKDRIEQVGTDRNGLNALCEGYLRFFSEIDPSRPELNADPSLLN